MPALPRFFRQLVREGSLPLSDADALRGRSARDLRIVVEQGLELLGDGMGTALVDAGLRERDVDDQVTADSLRKDTHYAKLLARGDSVGPDAPNGARVRVVQRALMAVAARAADMPEAMRLPQYGADGDFGNETTKGVKAAQRRFGVATDGVFGEKLAAGLVDLLGAEPVPELFAERPEPQISSGAEQIAANARGICEATPDQPYRKTVGGRRYRYFATMFGRNHPGGIRKLTGPKNISYGLSSHPTGYWKCNIFGGICIGLAGLYAAEFEWSSRSSARHYPRAERFGPRLSRSWHWQMITHLDHRNPDHHIEAVLSPAHDEEILEMLRSMRPGDLFFVDHPGAPGNNGGHTRVCVAPAEPDDPDAAPLFAQAGVDAAIMRRDGLKKLKSVEGPEGVGPGELQYWLLRYRD